jgi:hypothetical protein
MSTTFSRVVLVKASPCEAEQAKHNQDHADRSRHGGLRWQLGANHELWRLALVSQHTETCTLPRPVCNYFSTTFFTCPTFF